MLQLSHTSPIRNLPVKKAALVKYKCQRSNVDTHKPLLKIVLSLQVSQNSETEGTFCGNFFQIFEIEGNISKRYSYYLYSLKNILHIEKETVIEEYRTTDLKKK